MMLSRIVMEGLDKAGYKNVTHAHNGQEAWEYLEDIRKSGADIPSHVALLITDIEMPHGRASPVKTHKRFRSIA